jgi:hypothetical protein
MKGQMSGESRAARRRAAALGVVIAATALSALLLAPPAGASFHLVMVKEIYAGGTTSDFIELQMPSQGENLVMNHELDIYNASGTVVDTITPSMNAGNGQNQRSILFGDNGVESEFGVEPDFVDADLALSPGGGAVCWRDGTPPDCVAWGNFTGTLPNPAGNPAAPSGIPAGMSITRSIARGCATLLERSADDTNDSAADFSVTTPSPRPNSVAPTEMACPTVPNTTINNKPPSATNSTTASFTYSSSQQGSSFECRLDAAAAFTSCPSGGITYMDLTNGQHTFRVRAIGAAGPDPTPATYTWTIDTSGPPPVPETTIDGGPGGKTKDRTPSFRFSSDPAADSFQCKIDSKPYKSCSSPYTTARLSFGKHTFRVRAVGAGGTDPTPAKRGFKVVRKR